MQNDDPRAALDALVTRYGESYAALSRMLGRNAAYLQQFVRRGSPRRLAERDRRLLANYFRVDERLLGASAAAALPSTSAIMVPRIDAAASAGAGALVDADRPAGSYLVDPALIAMLRVRAQDVSIIGARGESMLPTIFPEDELLVDRSDQRVTARPGIFVIRVDGLLMVKRVARQGDRYVITSDNPDYPGVDSDDVVVIGRVVGLSRALR